MDIECGTWGEGAEKSDVGRYFSAWWSVSSPAAPREVYGSSIFPAGIDEAVGIRAPEVGVVPAVSLPAGVSAQSLSIVVVVWAPSISLSGKTG